MGIRQYRVVYLGVCEWSCSTFSDWSPTTTTLPSFRSYSVLRYVGRERNCDHDSIGVSGADPIPGAEFRGGLAGALGRRTRRRSGAVMQGAQGYQTTKTIRRHGVGIRQCRVEVSTGFPGPFPTFSDWSPTTTTLPSFRSYSVLRYVGHERNCDHNRGGVCVRVANPIPGAQFRGGLAGRLGGGGCEGATAGHASSGRCRLD